MGACPSATVVIRHIGGRIAVLMRAQNGAAEYVCDLPVEARRPRRYISKVLTAGLNKDPYTLDDWTQSPHQVLTPNEGNGSITVGVTVSSEELLY